MIVRPRPSDPCHRCGGELYLTATTPHPTMPGERVLPLCPRCDAHDPAAQGILAFFAAYSLVDEANRAELERLAEEWLAAKRATGSGVNETDLDGDIEAWRRGEFD